jgi:hypothetical protein
VHHHFHLDAFVLHDLLHRPIEQLAFESPAAKNHFDLGAFHFGHVADFALLAFDLTQIMIAIGPRGGVRQRAHRDRFGKGGGHT